MRRVRIELYNLKDFYLDFFCMHFFKYKNTGKSKIKLHHLTKCVINDLIGSMKRVVQSHAGKHFRQIFLYVMSRNFKWTSVINNTCNPQ